MRRPDPAELEFAFLALLIAVPMGYYVVRWLLAVIANA